MKKFVLMLALCCSPFALADAGMSDAGTMAGPVSVDGGIADAGTKGLVDGENVNLGGVAQTLKEAHPQSWKVLFGVSALILLLTVIARKVGGMFIPFLKTDRGGALTVLVLGLSGGLVNALAAGDGISTDGALLGAMASFMAAGGFTLVKKLLFPSDAPKPPAQS